MANKGTSGLAYGRACLAAATLFFVAAAHAAGGHHAVDDAAILEPGACKLEGWGTGAGGEKAVHAGGGCRVGPVELNAATEYARDGGSSQSAWGLQAKWATELVPGFSAGLSLSPVWQSHVRPRYQGSSLAALFTWAARDDLALHLNLGRDFVHGGADQKRGGVSVEWIALPSWSLVAERYLEDGTHFLRGGARWAITENWSVDTSYAHRLSGPGASNWTVGTIWQFDRP
jgi:hypothetical protein